MRLFNKHKCYSVVCYPISAAVPQNTAQNAQAIQAGSQGKTESAAVPSRPKG